MANLQGILKSIRDIMWQDNGLNGDAQRIEQLGWMLFFKIFSDKDQDLELADDNYKSPIPAELHWGNWAGDDEGMTGDELQEFVDRTLFPTLRNIPVVDNKRALILREVFEGNNNYMKSGINIRKVLNKLNELDFNVAKDRHQFGELYETILKDLQSAGKSGEFYTPRAITQFLTEMVNPQIGEKVLDLAAGTGGFLTATIEHLRKENTSLETLKAIQDNVIGWEYKPLPFLLATTNLILHDVEVPNITFRDALDQPLSKLHRTRPRERHSGESAVWRHCRQQQRNEFSAELSDKGKRGFVFDFDDSSFENGRTRRNRFAGRKFDGRRRETASPRKACSRMQSTYDYPLAEQRFSALRDGGDESFIFYQRNADARNLVLRTPFARRSKELQQNENDSPGRISAD